MDNLRKRFARSYRVCPESGCWIWNGYLFPTGYAKIRAGGGVTLLAHRASWALNRGGIPDGMVVMHTCDNPSCVNPAHLDLGTQKENMADMVQKGRCGNRGKHANHSKGESHYAAKITAEQALEIFLAPGELKEIGAPYGLTKHAVWRIKHRRAWKRVTEGY